MIQGVNVPDALDIAIALLPQLPFAVAAVAGLWYALATRRRHPRVSTLAAIAFVCLGCSVAIRAGIQFMLLGGGRPIDLAAQLALWGSLAGGLLFVSLVLLAVAAFLPR